MEYQAILTVLLAIVYRCSVLGVSHDVTTIEDVLDSVIISGSTGTNPEADRVAAMKLLINEIMFDEGVKPYDPKQLTDRINTALMHDEAWADAVNESLIDTTKLETEERLEKDIYTLRNQRRQERLGKVLKDATYKLNSGKVVYSDMLEHAKDTVLSLENVITDYTGQDTAVIKSASTRDHKSMETVYESSSDILEGAMVYRLPFKKLNTALQGGVRLTDTVMISALQHSYKSGMTMQLATGIPQINKPVIREGKGTPTVGRCSFEDSLENNFLFMYKEMYHNATGEALVDNDPTTDSERATKVINKLRAKGWEVEFTRVNPSGWSYRDIQNYVEQLETTYDLDVQVLVLDYLLLIPTTGCIVTGPFGTDKRDLLRRMRNWAAARATALITPQQLNTTAKAKQREDIAAKDFLHHIKGCGMYADSGQLDQELDVGILLHRVKHEGEWYLHVVLEKHRTPTVIPDSQKSFFIPFSSNGMPLLADEITGNDRSIRKLSTVASEEEFM